MLCSSDEQNDGIETREEVAAHSPPPSLVPRIHVILTRRLQHTHPLIGNDLTSVGERVGIKYINRGDVRLCSCNDYVVQ